MAAGPRDEELTPRFKREKVETHLQQLLPDRKKRGVGGFLHGFNTLSAERAGQARHRFRARGIPGEQKPGLGRAAP